MDSDTLELWNSMSKEEQDACKKQRNDILQQDLLQSDQDGIDVEKSLMATLKDMISRKIMKENYTDKDARTVALALECIKGCEASIKEYEKDILLLVKYPVGSKYRPNIVLLKEVK